MAFGCEHVLKDKMETVAKGNSTGSQECLLFSGDEESATLEKFLDEGFDDLSGEGLEKIVEVDPSLTLAFLAES